MKICVIGGANMDITAASAGPFVAGDSNPGTVRTAPGGVGRNIAHNLCLLGDEVSLVTVFGGDGFGKMLKSHCRSLGMDLSLSQTVSSARNACFVSVGGPDGELLGGVADMAVTGLMTPEWLEERLDRINGFDAVVGLLRFRYFLCPARQGFYRLGTLEGQGVDFGWGSCQQSGP